MSVLRFDISFEIEPAGLVDQHLAARRRHRGRTSHTQEFVVTVLQLRPCSLAGGHLTVSAINRLWKAMASAKPSNWKQSGESLANNAVAAEHPFRSGQVNPRSKVNTPETPTGRSMLRSAAIPGGATKTRECGAMMDSRTSQPGGIVMVSPDTLIVR